ncbi:MAG: interleukin-like EMT inducer domain-containing protein [Anaerolineae bacterium]
MKNWLTRLRNMHLAVIGLYTLLALILTYPLVARFATHVPGSELWAFDEYTFVWNLWWFKQAVLNLRTNPLYTDYIFYPVGMNLVLYTYTIFNAMAALPLEALFSLIVASNTATLFAFVFSAYGTFLLVRYLLTELGTPVVPRSSFPVPTLAAFLAGLSYGFTTSKFVYAALGHYNAVGTQWIPLFTLYFVKTIREPARRNAMMAGLFLAMAMLVEMNVGVFLGMLALILLLFVRRSKLEGIGQKAGQKYALLRRLTVLATTAVLLYLPVLIPVVAEFAAGDYALKGWGDAQKLSVDLFGFVTPSDLHSLWGGDWAQELTRVKEGTARFADVNTVFLGYVTLLLALLGAIRYWPRVKAWVVSGVVFALFCLGPLLQINGRSLFDLDGLEVTFPMPFIALHYIPIVRANRIPNRFSVVLLLCMAVLVGYASLEILGWVGRVEKQRWRTGARAVLPLLSFLLLALLLLFEHLSVPLPLTDARVPEIYHRIAAEPGDFAILTTPLGWRNSFTVQGAENTRTEYYQTVHGKRLLSGNTSRNPPFKFEYFARVPVLRSIVDLEIYKDVPPEIREEDRERALEVLRFYDIRYVVVNPAVPGRQPYADNRERVREYIEEVLPVEKVYDSEGVVAYQVAQPPLSQEITIDLGTESSWMYRGEGWSRDEEIAGASANWAVAQGAHLFFPIGERRDYRLTLNMVPFAYPEAPTQTVEVTLNGRPLPQKLTLAPAWTSHQVDIPATYLRSGLNEIAFHFAYLASPHEVLPGDFSIGQTGLRSPVDITVNSAGLTAGNFAYITVDGKEASTHRRGYNLAVIDPQSGHILDKRGFDTWANQYESQAMAQFMADIPQGYIVVVAVKEDGAKSLTQEGVEALRSIGAQEDLRGTEYRSHAIIGVKGAAPGTALELSAEGNAYLHVGHNPDERTLAVAVDWLHLAPK